MRFLADENFPIDSVNFLRRNGHDVDSIQEASPALPDPAVLDRAVRTDRILLTFDRDFGDLVFNHHLRAPRGIVYFRFELLIPEEPAGMLLELLPELNLDGQITVISRRNVRQRELPI